MEHNVLPDVGRLSAACKTPADDAAQLKGVDAIVIVPPQVHQNRVGTGQAYINAAKAAGVKHIIVSVLYLCLFVCLSVGYDPAGTEPEAVLLCDIQLISAGVARKPELIFGAGMAALERAVSESGVPFTIVQCSMFHENLWAHQPTISAAAQSAIYAPCNKPDVPMQSIAIADIAQAVTTIVTAVLTPSSAKRHAGKTYWLGGAALSMNELAAAVSGVIGRTVKFVSVSDEVAIKSMTDRGLPEQFAKGLCELYHWLETSPIQTEQKTATNLLGGKTPQSIADWLTPNAAAFASGASSGAGATEIKFCMC